ncbi:MAG: ketoacid-CoA transferase, partial [Deltaproteobacteria bacterium]
SKKMYLAACYPGITPEKIQQETGFTLDLSRAVVSAPPTTSELEVLRQRCDPQRLILGE